MTSSSTAMQSASERRAAEAELKALVTRYAAAQASLVETTRRWLDKRLPGAHQIVYEYKDFVVISFSPNGKGYDGVLALHAGVDGVKLYLNNGKGLADPAKLLRGTGKLVRYIELPDRSTLKRAEVLALVDAAVARSAVSFDGEGPGPLVVRATTAQKLRNA